MSRACAHMRPLIVQPIDDTYINMVTTVKTMLESHGLPLRETTITYMVSIGLSALKRYGDASFTLETEMQLRTAQHKPAKRMPKRKKEKILFPARF